MGAAGGGGGPGAGEYAGAFGALCGGRGRALGKRSKSATGAAAPRVFRLHGGAAGGGGGAAMLEWERPGAALRRAPRAPRRLELRAVSRVEVLGAGPVAGLRLYYQAWSRRPRVLHLTADPRGVEDSSFEATVRVLLYALTAESHGLRSFDVALARSVRRASLQKLLALLNASLQAACVRPKEEAELAAQGGRGEMEPNFDAPASVPGCRALPPKHNFLQDDGGGGPARSAALHRTRRVTLPATQEGSET